MPCGKASHGVGLGPPDGGRRGARLVQDGNDRGGEHHILRDSARERSGFSGTLAQIMDDIAAVASTGADELILDLHLQDWWQNTRQILDAALEIRELVSATGL